MKDYFDLFGLPRRFRLDTGALEEAYRKVELQVHPDRFAAASPAMRRAAEQWSVRANEAYAVLRDPLRRASYLCEQAGFPVAAESNTRMPPEFLMKQMQWRERLEESAGGEDLRALYEEVWLEREALLGGIAADLDDLASPGRAVEKVRSLMFVEKMVREVRKAVDQN